MSTAPKDPASSTTTTTTPPGPSNLLSSFSTSASTYERRIGRATRAIATHILTTPNIFPPLPASSSSAAARILDNACGTGAITAAALQLYPSASLDAVDASPGMVGIMESQVAAHNWHSNVRTAVMGGEALTFADATFDASVTNFGIFFFADAVQGAREVRRTLKAGGTGVVTCWKTVPFNALNDAAEEIVRPAKPFTRPAFLDRWRDPATLENTLRDAGFADVEMHSREVWFWGTDLSDLSGALVENMLGFVGDDWSEAEKGRLDGPGGAMMEVLNGSVGAKLVQKLDGEGEEWKGRVGVKCTAWIAVARK
jgi:ubiquinone/menaquinone biosynthesis C-methylase UbiE